MLGARSLSHALLISTLIAGCGSPPPPEPDASGADAGRICETDPDCDDGLFCNGVELCRPAASGASERGCIAAVDAACFDGQVCSEMARACRTDCGMTEDADGDGSRSADCGGDDCDDADPLRFPGNPELCDEGNHDEDCDDTTYGSRNGDRDEHDDRRCCNVRDDDPTMLNCGEDCDDLRRGVNPDNPEVCDRLDNDCDGAIDEGVTVEGFVDADRDGRGTGDAVLVCAGAVGYALEGGDCDDADPARRPGGPELCDARDNDCDAAIDEDATAVVWYRDADGDGFGSARTGTVTSCEPLAGFSLLGNDCDDTRSGVGPAASEACNGIDDDCNGLADFEVGPGDFEDDDDDGFVDLGCGSAGDDCDDTSALTHPGATEICDGRDNDCDGTSDDLTGMIAWYPDVDGDGWGDGTREPITSCTEPAGRVGRALDCDDSDPDRHPERADLCDGAEEDCDLEIDEDATRVLYYVGDRDGDGYAGGAAMPSCMPIAGATTLGGDCDDDRADLAPGVAETCDGEDDDCDGSTDEALGTISCGMASCRVVLAACSGGTPTACTPDVGAPEICNGADDDCDGTPDDEPAATAACALAGAVDQCLRGTCRVVSCLAGRADCDAGDANGCEVDLATEELHCGACGHQCAPGVSCTSGRCENEILELALGSRHSCALLGWGGAYCWGDNTVGQVGALSTTPRFATATAVRWSDGTGATPLLDTSVEISAGLETTCVRRIRSRADQLVTCWGQGSGYELGAGPTVFIREGTYSSGVSFTDGLAQVEFGGRFHIVRTNGGALFFSGTDNHGERGNGIVGGGTGHYYNPAAVTGGVTAITDFHCGRFHCLARDASSPTLTFVWGRNDVGQIDPSALALDRPNVQGVDLGAWVTIAAGDMHTCLVRPSGAVACSGSNARGQLGNGTTTTMASAGFLENGANALGGIDSHTDTTCAIDAAGAITCWGANDFGQCGVATPAEIVTPRAIDTGGVAAREIAVGERHACAVLVTNQVICWGQGAFGQLGHGAVTDSVTPVFVTGLP